MSVQYGAAVFRKLSAEVKSGLVFLQARALHDRFEFALVVPEILYILIITRHGIIHAEQGAFGGIFLL